MRIYRGYIRVMQGYYRYIYIYTYNPGHVELDGKEHER